jgi:hypothetical protein
VAAVAIYDEVQVEEVMYVSGSARACVVFTSADYVLFFSGNNRFFMTMGQTRQGIWGIVDVPWCRLIDRLIVSSTPSTFAKSK